MMERSEARSLIASYVDGEISQESAHEFEIYLEKDPECAREMETLRGFRDGFREANPLLNAPPYLRRSIERLSTERSKGTRGSRIFQSVWVRTVAACIVATTLGVLLLNWVQRGQIPISLFVSDHMEYSQRQEVVQLKTYDRIELQNWFIGQLPFTPQIPSLPGTLEGGRLCHIAEEMVALVFYDWNGHRVSLFVGDGRNIKIRWIEGQLGLDQSGVSFTSERGNAAAVWRKSGLIYILVAACPEEELRKFVEDWSDKNEV